MPANQQTTDVPADWLAAVVHLLNEMAGEGLSMQGCEDPADLMTELVNHLGISEDENDVWKAAVMKLIGVTNDAR